MDRTELCRTCGYSLRGLPVTGLCPECGRSVESSLQGDQLAYADPAYLARLYNGALVIEVGQVARIFVTPTTVLLSELWGPGGALAGVSLQVVGLVATVVGWWIFSTRDPGKLRDMGDRPRRVVRWTIGLGTVAILGGLALNQLLPALTARATTSGGSAASAGVSAMQFLSIVGMLAGLIAWVALFFSSMRYLRWLAPRVPDEALEKKTRTYVWLLPLLYVLGFGIGGIIANVLLLVMFEKLRRKIAAILAHVAGEGAARAAQRIS